MGGIGNKILGSVKINFFVVYRKLGGEEKCFVGFMFKYCLVLGFWVNYFLYLFFFWSYRLKIYIVFWNFWLVELNISVLGKSISKKII